jgi:hypothetical protein
MGGGWHVLSVELDLAGGRTALQCRLMRERQGDAVADVGIGIGHNAVLLVEVLDRCSG